MYPRRVMCDVLAEMRDCFKTFNFSPIPGLIEEAQSMANRMEAGLEDKKDVEKWRKEAKDLGSSNEKLLCDIDNLEKKRDDILDIIESCEADIKRLREHGVIIAPIVK